MTTIVIVPESKCPECDAGDDFNNRPKVGDSDGLWWWRCYRATCPVMYYLPETGEVEYEG